MDIVGFRYLSASAEFGNFGRAAESLGLTTSTISRRVGRLEDELGLTIFERGRFGIRLTTGGKAVMVHVRRVLADFDAVLQAGSCNGSGQIGSIRLGVLMPPIGEPLRSLLIDWRQKHPNTEIKLHEMNEREIAQALTERRLDVALMIFGVKIPTGYHDWRLISLPSRGLPRRTLRQSMFAPGSSSSRQTGFRSSSERPVLAIFTRELKVRVRPITAVSRPHTSFGRAGWYLGSRHTRNVG
jgi:DNA-binding transcriptional LysR family regulator